MVRLQLTALVCVTACSQAPSVLADPPQDTLVADTDTHIDTDALPVTGAPTEAAPFQDTSADNERWLAGAWSDLNAWAQWETLVGIGSPWKEANAQWEIDTSRRFAVAVLADNQPVVDANVTLHRQGQDVWTSRTDHLGNAELFPSAFSTTAGSWDLTVTSRGHVLERFSLTARYSPRLALYLDDEAHAPADEVEILWAVDTRATQERTVTWLQEHLPAALEALDEQLSPTRLPRYGLTLFNDDVLVPAALSPDITAVTDLLDVAEFAGDGPPHLARVLQDAAQRRWSEVARARLLFLLIGDVPPDESELTALHAAAEALVQQGVQVIAVSTSQDVPTSFLLRNLASLSNGAWWFHLTEGPPKATVLVGDYDADDLDTLMIEAVRRASDLPR